jgi:chromosome segregation ATPase
MNERNDSTRFTLHDDAPPESVYASDVENLRIEKLSSRITLIAFLIPILLAVALAVAYFDLQKRMARTYDTGSMGVQNLSKDLESRFSNLSLKLAKLEAQQADQAKKLETGTAALQVNLKKALADFKRISDDMPDQKSFTDLANQTQASVAAVQKEVADLNAAFEKFDEELAAQILLMADRLKKDQGRLAAVEEKTRQLEAEKLSKPAMDLELDLERLALQEMVNEKTRRLEKTLDALSKKIDAVDRRQQTQAAPSASAQPAASARTPAAPSPSTRPADTPGIVEQTIE